ncbi:hypothetical protein [Halobacillus amylolyticus]|uniref:DUF1328 domain-containing protein n=1 Tax=Halobacillus amylolyticus TaxID=2932259 RepID=A0ABY4H615_9BACI|nr:hypothetical protein [Halobacillus amylolyticus]UOR10299.1 hypothetical protein MUO15_11270 [Halobacillus amylolyticus]
MYHLATLYLACILAGFALANIPTSAVITAEVASFFSIIGGIAIIVFALALLYLGVKALINK